MNTNKHKLRPAMIGGIILYLILPALWQIWAAPTLPAPITQTLTQDTNGMVTATNRVTFKNGLAVTNAPTAPNDVARLTDLMSATQDMSGLFLRKNVDESTTGKFLATNHPDSIIQGAVILRTPNGGILLRSSGSGIDPSQFPTVGTNSSQCVAMGDYAFADGDECFAFGFASAAIGSANVSWGNNAQTSGYGNLALGNGAGAFGSANSSFQGWILGTNSLAFSGSILGDITNVYGGQDCLAIFGIVHGETNVVVSGYAIGQGAYVTNNMAFVVSLISKEEWQGEEGAITNASHRDREFAVYAQGGARFELFGSLFDVLGDIRSSNANFQTSLTASGLKYPASDGASNDVLITDGAGNLAFTTLAAGGGGDVFASSNNNFSATNSFSKGVYGGVAPGTNLLLSSTTHATKGTVQIGVNGIYLNETPLNANFHALGGVDIGTLAGVISLHGTYNTGDPANGGRTIDFNHTGLGGGVGISLSDSAGWKLLQVTRTNPSLVAQEGSWISYPGNANITPLMIRGATGQTSPLMILSNRTTGATTYFNSNGWIGVGAPPNYPVDVLAGGNSRVRAQFGSFNNLTGFGVGDNPNIDIAGATMQGSDGQANFKWGERQFYSANGSPKLRYDSDPWLFGLWSSAAMSVTGQLSAAALKYPLADGSSNQVMATDGAGNLGFISQAGGGSDPTRVLILNGTATNLRVFDKITISDQAFVGTTNRASDHWQANTTLLAICGTNNLPSVIEIAPFKENMAPALTLSRMQTGVPFDSTKPWAFTINADNVLRLANMVSGRGWNALLNDIITTRRGISFKVSGSDSFVGFGTTNPLAQVHIVGEDANASRSILDGFGTTSPFFDLRKARGTYEGPTGVGNTDTIGSIRFWGYQGPQASFQLGAQINAEVSGTPGAIASAVGTDIGFYLQDTNGVQTQVLRLKGNDKSAVFSAASVTGQLTAANLKYPLADGSSNQVLNTDGAGNLSFKTSTTPNPLSIGQQQLKGFSEGFFVSQVMGGSVNAGTVNDWNLGIGNWALQSLGTNAPGNTAYGNRSLASLFNGTNNAAFGHKALFSLTNHSENAAFGGFSLFDAHGAGNSAFGFESGKNFTNGNYNVFIGLGATAKDGTTNSGCIGANAYVGSSDTFVIGDTNVTLVVGRTSKKGSEKLNVSGKTILGEIGNEFTAIIHTNASLGFPSTLILGQTEDATMLLTGAQAGKPVMAGFPADMPADSIFTAYCPSNGVIAVRRSAIASGAAYTNTFTALQIITP